MKYFELDKNYFFASDEHIKLFFIMSNLENALKVSGFVQGQPGKAASPNWNAFCAAIGNNIFDRLQTHENAQIFFDAPPKTLIMVDDQKTSFRNEDAPKNFQQLLEAVRRVRNNTFHGNKMMPSARDSALMNASIFVVAEALEECSKNDKLHVVHRHFFRGRRAL